MFARKPFLAVLGLVASVSPAFAVSTPDTRPPEDPSVRWQFTTGLDFSTGEFGGNHTTDIITVPFAAKAYFGDWNVRVSIPYLSIHGPANVIIFGEDGGETGGEIGGGGGHGENTQTTNGFGDTTVTLTRSWNHIHGGPMYIDAKARIRLPTGDEDEGLGVGATDFGLDGEVGWAWDRRGVYLSLGRRFRGDSDFFTRRDGWVSSAGGWVAAGERIDLGGFYDWSQHSIAGFEDRHDVGGYATYRLRPGLKLQATAIAGLSETSPDFQVGLLLIYRPDVT